MLHQIYLLFERKCIKKYKQFNIYSLHNICLHTYKISCHDSQNLINKIFFDGPLLDIQYSIVRNHEELRPTVVLRVVQYNVSKTTSDKNLPRVVRKWMKAFGWKVEKRNGVTDVLCLFLFGGRSFPV